MRDYKPTQAKPQPRARWLIWFITGLGLPLLTVALLLPDPDAPPPLPALEPDAGFSAAPVAADASADAPPAVAPAAATIVASKEIPAFVAAPMAQR